MCLHLEGSETLQRDDDDDDDDDDEYEERLGKLKSLLIEFDDWDLDEERLELLRRLDPLIVQCTGNFAGLLGFLEDYKILTLINDAINYQEGEPDSNAGTRFIEFVLRSGYRDEPAVDEGASSPKLLYCPTPLHLATRCRSESSLRNVFAMYPRLDVTYTEKRSGLAHLHVACIHGLRDLVASFLDRGGYSLDHRVLRTGETPLHLAARHRRREVAALLLTRGADANARDLRARTPLHAICARAAANADDSDDVAMAKTLFDYHRRVRDESPHDTGWRDKCELLRSLLYDPGSAASLANVRFEYYRPGVDVDAQDRVDNTPLHLALHNGKLRLAAFLLERGADLTLRNTWNRRPTYCCPRNNRDSPLHLALKLGLERTTKGLLLARAVDPNRVNGKGATPLHVICGGNNPMIGRHDRAPKLLKLVLESCDKIGKSPWLDAPDDEGRTPLQLAVASLQPRLVMILLARGASLSKFVFPSEEYFGADVVALEHPYHRDAFKLRLAAAALVTLELLERWGYELKLADALTIMRFFDRHGLFETRSAATARQFDYLWYRNEPAARRSTAMINDRRRSSSSRPKSVLRRRRRRRPRTRRPIPSRMKRTDAKPRRRRVAENAPRIMINRRVSLYNLLRSRPTERAATRRRVTYADYYAFACSEKLWHLVPRRRRAGACAALRLCEIMSRSFFSGWAVRCLMSFRLSYETCEMIVDRLTENRDTWRICEAAVS